jgi:transcription antitermination protein NusB
MPSRRKARELALQMLFQWDLSGQPAEQVASTFIGSRKAGPEITRFARELFEGTVKEAGTIDAQLQAHSEHWRMARMAAVDRNILRLAVYEMVFVPDNPPAVIIDEALELARRFSTIDSVEFVNGVLEAIRKSTIPSK